MAEKTGRVPKSESMKGTIPSQRSLLRPSLRLRNNNEKDVRASVSAFTDDFSRVPAGLDTVGNQGPVSSTCPLSPRTCPFGGSCHSCPVQVQTKLKIGAPDDEYEREADRVADQVMRMPSPEGAVDVAVLTPRESMVISRACTECEDTMLPEEER